MVNNLEITRLEILYRVSRELTTSLDLHEVLSRVLTLAASNIGAERASLIVIDENGKPLDAVNLYDGRISPNRPHTISMIISHGLAGWVLRNREAVIIPNTHLDSRWFIQRDGDHCDDQPKSALCVPLLAQEQPLGVLTIVHPRVGFFTSDHLNLQQAIADIAAIAIRNAHLFNDAQRSRSLYQGLFDQSVDPIFITNQTGRILQANRQAQIFTGYSAAELRKLNLTTLDALSADRLPALQKRLASSNILHYESTLLSKNRTARPVEARAAYVSARMDTAIQWVYHDITERKQLDSLRNDLTAMLYHDLRSPLSNIVSSLEMMALTHPGEQSAQLEELLDIANRSSAHLQRLTSSLLDINNLESGRQITTKTDGNIVKLLDDAVDIVEPVLRTKTLTLTRHIPAILPLIPMDEDMIRRVIINLLENAVKYSPAASSINVALEMDEHYLFFKVSDQGKGIPEEFREKIFDKFITLQAENGIKGLGLGLAFCRLAVQAHGGTIWMESNTGSGSVFIFSLPLSAGD